MTEILHSFGAGISFAVGVTVGAVLCRIATREGRQEMATAVRAHQVQVEARLAVYAANSGRIADALEVLAERKTR